jgi:hypothetical protein
MRGLTVVQPGRIGSLLAAAIITASALCAAPSLLLAQRSVMLGVSAGLSLPTGEMADAQTSGYHIGGQLTLAPAGAAPIEFIVDVTYHDFDGNSDMLFPFSFRYVNATANAAYVFPGLTVRPYVLGGLGLFMGKADLPGADSESDFGFSAGAGARFVLSGFSTFIQAKANFVSDHTFIPISFGVIF